MKRRLLGNSGMDLPELTLGTWLTFSTAHQDTANALVAAAFDAGIDAFDTADVYGIGDGERALATALRGHPRETYFIASKVFFPMSDAPEDRGLSRAHILDSIDRSLGRLETDHLDLYQCHRFDPDIPLEETVQTLGELVLEGKIRAWGTSVWSAGELRQATEVAESLGVAGPSSEQPRYNLLCQEPEDEIFPACSDLGLGTLTWSPLAQGFLTGKYPEKGPPPGRSRGSNPNPQGVFLINALDSAEAFGRVRALAAVATEAGITLPCLALAWCLRRKDVTTVLLGASRVEQLVANLEAVEVDWTPELENAVSAAAAGPHIDL